MQPVVYAGKAYLVETNHGTEVVPYDLVGGLMATDGVLMAVGVKVDGDSVDYRPLLDFIESANVESVELRDGFLARMSAPGYMDCTAWELHDTAAKAEASLREHYMDDEDDGEEG